MFFLLFALSFQAAPERVVYESVIHDRGKTIGTTILIEVNGQNVGGWIQKHDYAAIEKGLKTETGYQFDAAGNHYQMNTRTNRLAYGGPDGTGDQRLSRMEPMRGRVYKITEETDEGREITLQTDHGEQYLKAEQEPAVWKHNGPPVAKYQLERFEEILGKTVTVWRIRTGGTWTMEVIEEPEGMDILPKVPKEKKRKR